MSPQREPPDGLPDDELPGPPPGLAFEDLLFWWFDALAEVPADERTQRLDALDPALRQRVEELLRARDDGIGSDLFEPDEVVHTWPPDEVRDAGPEEPALSTWLRADTLLDDRYALGRRLGAGTFGTVHEAVDRITDQSVAVKVLSRPRGAFGRGSQREFDALLLLDLPGVVRLLEEGECRGHRYFVFEKIEGQPFPGRPVPAPWDDIARTVVDLLQTVGRVHAGGVAHGDVKPGNVLVDDSGWPTILDLGVCSGPEFDAGDGDRRRLAGTLLYMAPERLTREVVRPTFAADLYAVGLLIVYALTGEVPHAQGGRDGLAQRRTAEPVDLRGLSELGAPPAVIEVLGELLARDPARRPATAADAAARLVGELPPLDVLRGLPLPGREPILREILGRVLEGRSVRVTGSLGSGRERLLAHVAEELRIRGVVVHEVPATASNAFGAALRGAHREAHPALGDPDPPDADGLEGWLASELGAGRVFVVACLEVLDDWSAAAIDRHRADGTFVFGALTGGPDAIALDPLSEEQLRGLFAGPQRLFHVPEDAAALLHERTAGVPARVVGELGAWVRAGLARLRRGRVVIDREALDRLALLPMLALPDRPGRGVRLPNDAALDTLWQIQLAGPLATPPFLAHVDGTEVPQVTARTRRLEADGLLHCTPSGRRVTTVSLPRCAQWDAERRRAFHAKIARALEPGAPWRVHHLLAAAAEPPTLLREASTRAAALRTEGRVARSLGLVREVLRWLRRRRPCVDADQVFALHRELAQSSIATNSPRWLELALFELRRAPERDARTRWLQGLVRAALAATIGDRRKALRLVRAIGEGPTAALELRRRSVWHLTASRARDAEWQEVHASCIAWAQAEGCARAQREAVAWRARAAYVAGNFAEAVDLARRLLDATRRPRSRLLVLLEAASNAIEAGDLGAAGPWSEEARELAARFRAPVVAARAEWFVQRIAYASETARLPDQELIDAARALPTYNARAAILLTEAAFAWRARCDESARRLASQARIAWLRADSRVAAMLAEALMHACGGPSTPAERERLVEMAPEVCPPGVALQVLGLCALRGGPLEPRHVRIAEQLFQRLAPAIRNQRREVLSPAEALAFVRGDAPPA